MQDGQQRRGLRFAVMTGNRDCFAWQADCLNRLLAVQRAEAVLRIRLIDEAMPRRGGGLVRKLRPVRLIGWKIFRKVATLRLRTTAFASVELPEGIRRLPELRCRLRGQCRHSQYLHPDDVDEIKRHELDFIMAFLGYRIIRGDILEAARFGVWSYHFADEQKFRGSPPGVWEIYTGEPVTGTVLQRLTPRLDAGVVLKKGQVPTNNHSISLTLAAIVDAAAAWPAEVCEDILAGRAAYASGAPSDTSAPIYKWPSNGQTLRLVLVLLWNNLAYLAGTLLGRRPRD